MYLYNITLLDYIWTLAFWACTVCFRGGSYLQSGNTLGNPNNKTYETNFKLKKFESNTLPSLLLSWIRSIMIEYILKLTVTCLPHAHINVYAWTVPHRTCCCVSLILKALFWGMNYMLSPLTGKENRAQRHWGSLARTGNRALCHLILCYFLFPGCVLLNKIWTCL